MHIHSPLSQHWRQTFRSFASFHCQPRNQPYQTPGNHWKQVLLSTFQPRWLVHEVSNRPPVFTTIAVPSQSSKMTSISLGSWGPFFLILLMGVLPISPTMSHSSCGPLSTVKYPQLILLIASSSWPHTYFLMTPLSSTGSKCLLLFAFLNTVLIVQNNWKEAAHAHHHRGSSLCYNMLCQEA